MLIVGRSAIWEESELRKCGGGWLATAAVCVEGREKAVRFEWTACTRKKYPQEQNTTNIIGNVFSEKCITSK